ncbi:dTDP-4-dehydrorhamnose reductase [Candidatus Aminicenantes bacterium AC-335-A11]|jgi:dTDP-4-dehydrorhamnose reductase|nr:dTDP-4-dehydrorhamnose reductase [SCandidatus Aminicenantes bacterium Aminicenantia_JdfR_composite]MCP2597236.1 dTDP-4-dehydrorhamnose reductase [Candidatus Aminicenantes bacterium AC-335-G13]MCP2605957.1 dTDP-4-dehydrorhamnose reductase [Candidatus Aminicenantes bacterium AC-708-I09]MCP2618296.1 dTDP-4-dehydrorhamnose reductase [Candidatus Aminicenantes bacterium AC-335-A11]MCP2620401.1 dTDP-4-dehydrorhamnose reductase [Candidatus Aminicenantes bacterium AC-334-E05]
MKVLIIGSNGQLGNDLVRVFDRDDLYPLTHQEIEITDFSRTKNIIEKFMPEVIINTAAFHNVPECEKKPERAFLVNSIGVKNLADICRANNITLVYISTDYVFDGKKNSPYNEDDTPNPLNVYGISKLAGEFLAKRTEKHYIIRVASLFGVSGCRAKGGGNFVKTMLNFAKTKESIQVTSNIICSPTYTLDAAKKIREILDEGFPYGIYHVTNSGSCSWYEFAVEIFNQIGANIKVERRIENEEIAGVKRPLYSALTSKKIKPLRHWKEALKAYLKEEKI